MKLLITFILFLVVGLMIPELLTAQPPPPSLPSMPSQAPIDGGLSLLAAAGGAYAWKKLRAEKKN